MGRQSLGDVVLSSVRPLVVRYCRARIGRRDDSFAVADMVATEALFAALRALPAEDGPLLAVTYRIALQMVDEQLDGEAGCADMAIDVTALPKPQREILILRAVCGLSAAETAEALGVSADAVRIAQHRALDQLRKSVNPDIPLTRLGRNDEAKSLRKCC
jgi:RNA polymerase sigma-70 factor, ECF subfamily